MNFWKLLSYINVYLFIASLALGVLAVYVTNDDRVIYVYPTPDNVDLLVYRDKTNNCFKLNKSKVACPVEESSMFTIPPQT